MSALHSAEPGAGHRLIQRDRISDGHDHNPIIPYHCPSAVANPRRGVRHRFGVVPFELIDQPVFTAKSGGFDSALSPQLFMVRYTLSADSCIAAEVQMPTL